MAAKNPVCNYQYYKYFLPNRRVAPLTSRQVEMIGQMDPNRKFKYLGALSKNLDDDSMNIFRQLEQIAPKRFKQMTNIGVTLADKERSALNSAQAITAQIDPQTKDMYGRVADKIASDYRKGEVMSPGERQILYPTFAKQMQELPTLVNQLDDALRRNDEQLTAYLAAQLTKTITSATAIAGDKNAVSVAMKSFENLNRVINRGGNLSSILANGVC